MSTLDLQFMSSRNARSQLLEGEQASRHLQGVYPGDVLSALASTAISAQTRRDWADKALRAYSNAISLDPSLAEAYVGRAAVYRFLERYPDARSDLQHAEKLGVAAATQEVGHVDRRLRTRRLVLLAVCALVTGSCALWLFRHSVLTTATTSHAESTPSTLPAAPAEQRSAPPEPRIRSAAISPTVAPSAGRILATSTPALHSAPGSAAMAGATPQVAPDANAARPATASPTVAAPPIVLATPVVAAAIEPRLQEQTCSECDSLIAALPGATALAKEDLEMTKLACRSSEGGGADAYRACVATQIALLDSVMPMPDLAVLTALDRQLLQRACKSTTSSGPAAYRRCVISQLISLAGAPDLPDVSGLTPERRRAVELACRDSADAGAAAYHNCMDRQMKSARRGPAPGPLPRT